MRTSIYMLIIFSLFLLSGCTTKEITKQDTASEQLPVKVEPALTKAISNSIQLNGLAVPHVQVPLFTAQPLNVQKVHVKIGDVVNENDVLISLDPEAALKQLSQAQDTVVKLQSALNTAKQAIPSEDQLVELDQLQKEIEEILTRTTELITQIQEGEVSTEDVLKQSLEVSIKQAQLANATSQLQPVSQATITELEAQLSQAKQAVDQAKELVAAAEIKSPINGIVASMNVVEKGLATPTLPLVTIIELTEIDATFQVNSFEVVRISPGTEVSLTFTGIEEPYIGKVETISPSVNPETNMFTVTIPVANTDNKIKGGMKATATIKIDEVEQALVIPIEAVLYEDNSPFVYIAVEGTAVKKSIETGIRDGEFIQVVSGLNLDEQVITEGKERLKDGDDIYVSN
ncbi:efflux RND transporter periplasmic adaptor subunit [Bacillus pinisoli]|uniref:efflux RND transporter periplasmic adaptor subunit n=1 Tax=Bacillus pinisoli TaxID=2901866 RepID=UPI001FF4A6BE|nr:efflux RND transporter periplasmic adaptor subunit [Bacillus pinisoli]